MKNSTQLLCFLTLTIGFVCGPSHAEDLQSVDVKIEQVISQVMQQNGIPGLSIAAAKDNQLIFAEGFGLANVEHVIPATADTRYRTASIAKSITAVAALSLCDQGKLDLDAEVQKYCAEYPKKQWPVTTRQLLGHLAGVRHYKKNGESTSTQKYFSLGSALQTFRDDELLHEPGTKYHYTTFGFNLVGSVIEGASHQAFEDLLQERIFDPAKMTRTLADDQHHVITGRAGGYIRPNDSQLRAFPSDHDFVAGELYNAPMHDTSMKIPGGGLLSTAPDLVRFAVALNTGELVSRQACQAMWTSQKTSDGKEIGYGMGWRVGKHAARKIVSHTGGQSGTSTVLVLVPETGTAVAIMCNLQHVQLTAAALMIVDALQTRKETDYADAIRKLDDVVGREVRQKALPAFSISLVDGDRAVWSKGYGFQDAAQTIPATSDTIYRVGSVSKLFTDIAVMQQVEAGKLDLDVPVQTYLPDFAPTNPFKVPITLRQLMSHRSGLVRESPIGNYFDPTEPTLDETVASLNQTTLVYPPNTKTKYSNAAIAVVGAVLERSFDQPHAQRVKTSILEPLEMGDSSFLLTESVRKKLATGWMRTEYGPRFEAPEFLLGTGPAGNMYSSVADLAKFLRWMFDSGAAKSGKIIDPETYRLMTTPVKNAEGKDEGFGIGFHIQDLDGETKIGHGGAVYGFSTQLEALPGRELGVAAVASLDGSNGVVRRLADYSLRLMIASQDGKPLPEYEFTTEIAPERAKQLVGTYHAADDDRFARINELDGDVTLRIGSYQYTLRSDMKGESYLTDDPSGFGIRVARESADRISIDGKAFDRVPDAPPDAIPPHWSGLIGEYGWDHNTLFILEDQGKLYALIEWFYYYPLTQVDEDTYLFPDYGLYHGEGLKFSRAPDGVATKVIAAEVDFRRREVGTKNGETFKIEPVKPVDDLRSAAMAAKPPAETGEFFETDLVDVAALDPTIKLDIRYATTNNFTGAVFYKQPRSFMQRDAATAVVRANQRLKERGLGLLIHDAYRPWHVTKMFWDATPGEFKDFVANPANGSRHNRGCAVDITLYDLQTGLPIQMVAGYDEFSSRSFPEYPGGTSRQRWYRDLLRATMQAEGFTVYEFEWWHFDYKDWKHYRIGNLTFEEIGK
ncbi:MAG: serine hydrolase [Planctomycetales bacterium]|nr:serine hydrolase [Planctomycetales bacterium]